MMTNTSRFSIADNSSNELISVKHTGEVGIGTTSPTEYIYQVQILQECKLMEKVEVMQDFILQKVVMIEWILDLPHLVNILIFMMVVHLLNFIVVVIL